MRVFDFVWNRAAAPARDIVRTGRVWVIVLLAMALVLSVASGCQRVREADSEYELALDQIETIQERLGEHEFYSLTAKDMEWLEDEFVILAERVDRIEELSTLPYGLDRAFGSETWGSARYRAVMDTLEVAGMLANAGQDIANIGQETLVALDERGIQAEAGESGDTWLDVLYRREAEMHAALAVMDEALVLRDQIDEESLPGRVRGNLVQIDAMIDRFSNQKELAAELPLAFSALGAEEPVRYLALFQNPTEMRPTGGFLGTMAFVDIHRGQITAYEFGDVYPISLAYQENVENPIDPPWAVGRFIRSDLLQYQDANWWPDFPESAELLMQMTTEAGMPPIDSVVAVQPETIERMLSVTGPVTVEVDGEPRRVTSENLLDEAERQRRISREGEETETGHKEVVALIGEALLAQLEDLEREDMIDSAFLMFDALDRRDMQTYSSDPAVQEFLEERNWAGLLEPEEGTPTIAAIFANVSGLKTSLSMQPGMNLDLQPAGEDGRIEAILTISFEHIGDQYADEFYEGFQRWWLDVILPEGSDYVGSDPSPAADPDASNGGSYVVPLDVGERHEIVIYFSMPETERLLIRRQPGLLTLGGSVEQEGCSETLDIELERDVVLLLDGDCPVIEVPEEDAFSAER